MTEAQQKWPATQRVHICSFLDLNNMGVSS